MSGFRLDRDRLGEVRPAIEWPKLWGPPPRWATRRTPSRPTFGAAVAALSASVGRPLFPSQRFVFDVGLEIVDPDDPDRPLTREQVDAGEWGWAYDDITDLEPRRAGKTAKIAPLILHRCGRPGVRASTWMTAQKREKAKQRYEDVRRDFFAVPEIRALLSRANISNAAEVMEWRESGSTFRPFAPDEDTMHGEDPDLAVVDELWSFPLAARDPIQAGYRPAWSVKTGQEWKFSAAGTARSGWLRYERAKGRRAVEAGERFRVGFFEWAIPELVPAVGKRGLVPVAELDDDGILELVWANHPRVGHGLRREFLASELGKGRPGFLRHYGGLDDLDQDDPSPIPAGILLRSQASDLAPMDGDGRVGVGFAIDQGRRQGAVYAAWRKPDGTARVVAVEVSPGTRWVAGRVAGVAETFGDVGAVAYRNVGLARDAGADLEPVFTDPDRLSLLKVPAADYAAASSRLYAGLVDGSESTILHDGKVSSALSDAIRAAQLPDSRIGAGWVQAGTEPIAAVEAASLAVWAADHVPVAVHAFKWSAY